MFSRVILAAISVAALAGVTACGSQEAANPAPSLAVATSPADPSADPAADPSAAPSANGAPLTITDPWIKTTKKGMTAAFGTLVNTSGKPVTVVAGSSPLSPKVELHEVVESKGKMVMQPKKGGFVIPANGSHELKPGGDHIMLMGVTEEVKPGAEVSFTLDLEGGGTFVFTAMGKDFAGAKEDYQPGMDMGGSHG
ncbi:copper chaperone PCu(A)C [Nonomuraea sp. NPDC059194]|uniref:copper chaperone PCu(A)C n=1 Tax=Nonomuraea sp. NPDC059194 TaxID=3346764 RepID=UPI00368DDC8A